MWSVYEHKDLHKKFGKMPRDILKRYEKWKDIVQVSGPSGLRLIKGFHDEALKGQWRGWRSSRLSLQVRVIYQIVEKMILVKVFDITPHDYRRK